MNLKLIQGSLFSLGFFATPAGAQSKQSSLEEPFQDSFKNLEHSGCYSLYYRNGRAGCSTADRETQAGPLYYYDGSKSLPADYDYVAVIEEFDLTKDTIDTIISSNSNNHLKGILVLNSTDSNDSSDYFSTGPMYPLGYGTPSANIGYGNIQFPWNGNGDGLNQYDIYGVPMAYINGWDTSYYLRNVASDGNKASGIEAQFDYYMGPDGVNSVDCLGWHDEHDGKWNPKCLPLGGTSVWGFAGSPPKSYYANYQVKNNNKEEEEESDNGRRRGLEEGNGDDDAAAYVSKKPAIVVGTSIDSTSMFHDLAPGANEGASNTLTLLMAAYLIGQSISDGSLDALPNRIVFGFFEGEAYGYLGSRSFLRDVMGFSCPDQYTVHSVSKNEDSELACLYPLRPSLKFKDIGNIAGMLTVDQVGIPTGEGLLYVHNEGEGGLGTFLANCLKNTGTKYHSAIATAAGDKADEYPYPPTPLTSLMSLSGGTYGGAVLTGYDYAYSKRPGFQSHMNSIDNMQMNLKSIASAATMIARTALAAAYDDGSYDYETASAYANDKIAALSYDNEVLVELADCLFVDGNCKMLKTYASMEAANEKDRTGFDISSGQSLGKPPNFYTSVYSIDYGQPFVRVGDKVYGAYNGKKYGNNKADGFGTQPRMLEQAIRNMLHDFLGRGSFKNENGNSVSPQSCHKMSDCSGVSYCSASGDVATCAGSKVCVCQRAHYHIALDEGLMPATNNYTGYFVETTNDNGVSPMWTEPYWDSATGVKVYRVSSNIPGFITIAAGGIALAGCFFLAVIVKVGMKKEKVY